MEYGPENWKAYLYAKHYKRVVMQETSLCISTTPKRHMKGPANSTNTQGTILVEGTSQHRKPTETLRNTLRIHLQGKRFSVMVQKCHRTEGELYWRSLGERVWFSIAEITQKVRLPQESMIVKRVFSMGQAASQLRHLKSSAAGHVCSTGPQPEEGEVLGS